MNEEFEWRPMQSSDVVGWSDLLTAVRESDLSWEFFTADDLLEDFDDPGRDFEHGSMGVFRGDRMIGYGALMARSAADPVHDMRYEGGVHPDYRGRGIGDKLINWAEGAAVTMHAGRFPGQPLTLSAMPNVTNTGAVALYEQRGYQPVRWFNGMLNDLSMPLPEIPIPPGVEIVGWAPESSAAAREIRNEAFRDHWGSTETSPESWDHFMATAAFRPLFSFIAYVGNEAVGCVISHEYAGDPSAIGRDVYVSIVGTRKAHRKQGIASALLMKAIDAALAAGFATASLEVDADSPTGALGLYEGLGFKVVHTSVTMNKALS
jgi:mycothiol synthase